MSGVITPILTPFNDDLSFNCELYLRHAHWLLQQGMHYISPFGTTGEALSLTADERISALDALINGGIDPARLMPGVGLCNLNVRPPLLPSSFEKTTNLIANLAGRLSDLQETNK